MTPPLAPDDRPRLTGAALAVLVAETPVDELVARLRTLHPDDAAELMALLPEETLRELRPEPGLLEVVDGFDDDDAADVVADLSPETKEYLLEGLAEGETVEQLLGFDEESAGGLMTTDVVTVLAGTTVGDAIAQLRRHAAADEHASIYQVYVVDAGHRLRGVLPLDRLVLVSPQRPVEQIVRAPEATVGPDLDQEQVARTMARFNLTAMPVVSPGGVLLGEVTFDDVIDVVEAERTEDLLQFGGTSASEELGGDWLEAVKSRLPWLGINLITAFLAGAVVYVFQSTISRVVALAVWMPIIAGMGGNAGTQALAVTVRRLALGLMPRQRAWRVIGKEALVGLANGLVIGLAVALAATLLGAGWRLGAVVLTAMWGNLMVAGLAGAFIPIVLERFGVDPAVASSIFVTTFTDVCGFLLLLGIGSLVLL